MTKQEILRVPVPDATETYTPVSHESFINQIETWINQTGLSTVKENFISNGKGTKLLGIYQLKGRDPEIGPSIAFRNSYDKSLTAGVATGANVFVCTNGMFIGEMVLIRKHTGAADTDISRFILEQTVKMTIEFERIVKIKEMMKTVSFSQKLLNSLIGHLYLEEKILQSEQLSIFREEFHNPTMDYGVDKMNAWNIYNLLTYSLEKKANPTRYMNQHKVIYDKFEKAFNFTT